MSKNFEISLALKIFLEDFKEDARTEVIAFFRNIELPYIPQIHSEIKCRLHPNDYGERPFKVRYVSINLDKNYQFAQKTFVTTENTFKLDSFLFHWNVYSIEELGKLCTENGWFVTLDGEVLGR